MNRCLVDHYKARLVAKQALLTEMDDALMKVLADGVEQATFDTGTWGARQHVKNLTPEKIQSQMSIIESQIERLCRMLGQTGGGLKRLTYSRYGRGVQ